MRLTLAFHFHEREQFQQRSYTCTCEFSSCPADRRSLLRHTNDASAMSCLWPVLTVSDRRRRVERKKKKKRKSAFCISECVCVRLCHRKCEEPPRGLFSSLTRAGLSSHNPLELLLNRKVKNDAYRRFFFLCVGTQRQHCCRLFSLRLCLSASETKFDFPSLTRLVCFHTCLLILPPSITRSRSPPPPGNNVRWSV